MRSAWPVHGILVALCVCVQGHGAWAQAEGPFFETVLSNELPSRSINCLAKDELGSLWVGTPNGLARIIGDQVRVWQQRPGDTTSLISNTVLTVDASDPRRVWVGTSRGLCSLDPVSGSIRRFPCRLPGLVRAKANTVRQVVRTDARSLWVATASDLLFFDMQREEWAVPGPRRKEQPDLRMPAVPGAMAYDPHRRMLWLGTKLGLYVLDSIALNEPLRPKDLEVFEVSTIVMSLTLDDRGWPWVYDPSRFSLTTVDPDTRVAHYAALPPNTDPFSIGTAMLIEPSGAAWFCRSDERVYQRRPGAVAWRTIGQAPEALWGLPNTLVRAMLRDASGTIWFGTDEGLLRSVPPIDGQHVVCAWHDAITVNRMRHHGGKLYICTHGAGAIVLDPQAPQQRDTLVHVSSMNKLNPVVPGRLVDLVADVLPMGNAGGLIGTGGGVMKWGSGSSTYRVDTTIVPDGSDLDWRRVRTLLKDADSSAWVLSSFHGLWRLGRDGDPPVLVFNGKLADGRELAPPTCAIADGRDGIWCGTSAGELVHFDRTGHAGTIMVLRDSTSLAGIEALAIAGDDRIWVGFDDGSFQAVEPTADIPVMHRPMSVVDRIIDMHISGNALWILTDGGLWFMDPTTNARARHQLLALHWGRPLAIAPDGNGGSYVAFSRAVMHIDGPGTRSVGAAPLAVIAAVLHHATYLPADPRHAYISTGYDQRALRILIAATGTSRPELVEFKYRLDPASPWSHLGRSRSLDLPDLWEGHHRVEIVALDESGSPGAESAVLELVIAPPWYRSFWAIILTIVLALLLVALVMWRLLARRLRAERQRAERERELLNERIRIAQDLHDDLGSSLALISMESELACMDVQDDGAREALRKVGEGAREVTDNMRRIVWALGSGQDTLGDLVAYIRSSAAELLDRAGIELETHIDLADPAVRLSVDQRRHLLLISKEMLLNAVKHAKATKVIIGMVRENGNLHISIADNGSGFDPDRTNGMGTGTISMRERARALGGEWQVRTAPGTGTTVEVIVPLGPAAV